MTKLLKTQKEIATILEQPPATTDNDKIKKVLLHNNLKMTIFGETIDTVCAIWNQYAGKQFGDKTADKVKKEIEQQLDNMFFVYFAGREIWLNLRDTTKKYNDNRFDTVKIITKKYDDKMLDNNKMQEIQPQMFCVYAIKNYIDDIDATTTKIIEAHKTALDYQQKLLSLYYTFSDLTGGEVQPINYNYIVKNYLF